MSYYQISRQISESTRLVLQKRTYYVRAVQVCRSGFTSSGLTRVMNDCLRFCPLWTGAVIFEMEGKFTTIVTKLSHGCAASIPQYPEQRARRRSQRSAGEDQLHDTGPAFRQEETKG